MPLNNWLNVLDEMVKVIAFIKSWPLSANLFAILCDKMGSANEELLPRDGYVAGKHSCGHWLVSWTSHFSPPTGQFLFERMTENYGYLDFSVW